MFHGDTILRRLDERNYMFIGNLTFVGDDYRVTISNGLITDGASIPRLFWSLIGCPFSGLYVGTAIIHDALYKSQVVDRQRADKIFLDMLVNNNVNKLKRTLMYLAVRIGGGSHWNKTKPKDISFIKFEEISNVQL